MKKGAKIAIAIITPVVLASTIVGTVLGIKRLKTILHQLEAIR